MQSGAPEKSCLPPFHKGRVSLLSFGAVMSQTVLRFAKIPKFASQKIKYELKHLSLPRPNNANSLIVYSYFTSTIF